MLVAYLLRMGGALHKPWDRVHRSGAVEGYNCGDILNALGAKGGADPGNAGAFKLENTAGVSGGYHLKGGGIVLGYALHRKVRQSLSHKLCRVLQNRKVAKPQKVHLQKPQLLKGGHGELAHNGLVVLGKGHVLIYRSFGYDHTGGVGGGVAGHALKVFGHVYKIVELIVPGIKLPQGL